MLKKIMCFILIMAVFSSCKRGVRSELDKDLIQKEVREMLHAYHNAIASGGLTAEFDYLDNSPQFYWVPPGYESALTYDSVKAILETNAQLFNKVNFSWETLEIHPLAKGLASFTGIVKGVMTDTTGLSSSMRIIESGTLIERKDGWKLLNGQSALINETPGNLP